MGRLAQHAGLHRVVFNYGLARVPAVMDQRAAERTYGIAGDDLTALQGWSAPVLERYWRATHAGVYPWFTDEQLSSRVPKEACRALAAALANWAKFKAGTRKGRRVGFPRFRRRKDCARFRMGADRARVVGSRVEQRAGRWWISFQVDVDRSDINACRAAPAGGPVVGIDLGIKTFATIAASDGTVTEVANPRHPGRKLSKLRRANKALARKQSGTSPTPGGLSSVAS